ncbi:c-type cytochrome [Lutibaculum baratangense]|uniref:Sulfite dehydrogenase cytochrome subunit SoxD n=1 Tax=Lutibaculum baratangense AMV1 TaxID=631454 RepID=V4TNH9_9HYPH|nr:c-type cytochrome [Lutibaculum baratangense]ESR27263.1 Sulfite dehydrogenase cytochrome subunit SoxD [Lutibaculum baratangense AMV1]
MRRAGEALGQVAALVAVLLLAGPAAAEARGAGDGEALFRACRGCHELGEGARHGIGPHLDGLFGRIAGSLEGYRYSSAMGRVGEAGLVWDAATLDRYLEKPQAFVPGTRMSYRGMPGEQDRAALIAWLEAATAEAPADNPAVASLPRPEIAAATLEIEGDPAYGEYLAGECVTCHQPSGRADGIPSIVGWPRDAFVRALFEYKTNVRSHQVMRMVTGNLGNEEIAALAAYFGQLSPQ